MTCWSYVQLFLSVFSAKDELEWNVEKPLVRKRGSKFMRKAFSSSIPKAKPVATHTGIRCLKPNMSRRTRDTMLYAFPSFDRCDSLLFFPSTLARHLNCGDIPAVAKLVTSHIGRKCDIRSSKPSPHQMDVPSMIRKCELVEELHPDHITCIHSTKVDGNQIKGIGFMKFTCSRAISHHMLEKIKDTDFSSIFKCSWEHDLRPAVERESWPEEEKQKMREVIDAGADFIVHAKMEVTITLNEARKISSLVFDIGCMTMHEAKYVE